MPDRQLFTGTAYVLGNSGSPRMKRQGMRSVENIDEPAAAATATDAEAATANAAEVIESSPGAATPVDRREQPGDEQMFDCLIPGMATLNEMFDIPRDEAAMQECIKGII
jgi:hypothetical protein